VMNQDVIKSLGYLKKSLKAIANAVNKDSQALVEFNVIATGVHNLINEIEKLETSIVPVPSMGVQFSVPPASPIAPLVQMVAQNVSLDSGNGIDFLDPIK